MSDCLHCVHGERSEFCWWLKKERKRVKKKERLHKAEDWATDIQKGGCTPPVALIRCLGLGTSVQAHSRRLVNVCKDEWTCFSC